MTLKERRVYLLLLLLMIILMLITLMISKNQIQLLEETKPKLGMLISPQLFIMQIELFHSSTKT